MRKCGYLWLVGLALLGLSSCVSGPGNGTVGMNEVQLIAQKGQPQQIIEPPSGGKILVYETSRMDQMAIIGTGAWGKPEQIYYWLDAQGNVTKVKYYPYGKRKFLFPSDYEPTETVTSPTPTEVAQAQPPAPSASPQEEIKKPVQAAPPTAPVAPPLPTPAAAPASPKAAPSVSEPKPSAPGAQGMTGAARLEHGLSKEEVTRLLGLPDRTEGFRTDGKGVVVWSYRLADQTGRRILTPLIFENGRLTGWGDAYYQMILRKARTQSQ
ncbi:MAG: DUF3192 domain-containing protein [Thermodesulfobacteriota bacterium]